MSVHSRPYQLKRGPWKRKGGPCVECGSESCRSLRSFACLSRCFQRALREHGYVRTTGYTEMLRAAGIALVSAPQPHGNEVTYTPGWAMAMLMSIRKQAKDEKRSLARGEITRRLATYCEARTEVDPPPTLTARLDELRTFATLQGWSWERGMWHKS